MTDLVMKYREKIIAESDIGYLEDKLKENKTAIRNVMKAIEMGIVTETTKARLQELEAEQKEVLSSLLFEKRNIPDVTRDHVQFFFESFRNTRQPFLCRYHFCVLSSRPVWSPALPP